MVLLLKLVVPEMITKFSTLYAARWIVTMFETAYRQSLFEPHKTSPPPPHFIFTIQWFSILLQLITLLFSNYALEPISNIV
jgi:hypothetical protein